MEFRSEFLHAFTDTEKVQPPAGGADPWRRPLHRDAMDFDNLARTLELRGHVHGPWCPVWRSNPALSTA
jgi:lipopolysaccharide export system protein LptC